MIQPCVSVVTTVYNGEKTIARCLDSTLKEKALNFEHIVWDDGSTDKTLEIVRSFSDERVRIIEAPRQGRAKSLHDACFSAKGRYIAILDADDVALNRRLYTQCSFLDCCEDVGWVGANQELAFESEDELIVRKYPTTDRSLKFLSAKCIPYSHSAVMFRTSFLEKGINYNPSLSYLIDFEFFIRLAAQTKVASIDRVLTRRYCSGTSYFNATFSEREKYEFLAVLNKRAIKSFKLPRYSMVYPIVRLFYHYIPFSVRPYARRVLGMRENRKRL